MWSAGSEELYLGNAGACFGRIGGHELQRVQAPGWEQALSAWAAQVASRPRPPRWRPRARVKVWLSGALARPFLLAPLEGLTKRREALALAQANAAEATGLAPDCVVWLGAWRAQRGGLAVALQPGLIEALLECERALPLRVSAMEPWWNWALTRRLALGIADELLAVDEEDAVTLLAREGGWLGAAQTLVPRPPAERVQAQLKRWALAQGREPQALVTARHVGAREGEGLETAAAGAVAWQAGAA